MCSYKKNELPKDIINKILIDFIDSQEQEIVKKELEKIFMKSWNVGSAQLVRSILFLINGNYSRIKEYAKILDPRDIISKAEKESNGRYNYFIDKFK